MKPICPKCGSLRMTRKEIKKGSFYFYCRACEDQIAREAVLWKE